MSISINKGQVWSLDLIVAVTIFIFGLIGIYLYALNINYHPEDIQNLMYKEGDLISSLILSEGYPENWETDNVKVPGILTNNLIDKAKIVNLYELSRTNEDYEMLRDLLDTKYDFYINFNRDIIINGESVSGIGKPGINLDKTSSGYFINVENPEFVIKVTRITIYENKPIRLDFYVW